MCPDDKPCTDPFGEKVSDLPKTCGDQQDGLGQARINEAAQAKEQSDVLWNGPLPGAGGETPGPGSKLLNLGGGGAP